MKKIAYILVAILLFFVLFLYVKFNSTNSNFIVGNTFEIGSRDSLRKISENLYDENYINSPLLFRLYVSYVGKDKNISAGIYRFNEKMTLLDVARKMSSGKYDIPSVVITIPEGFTNQEIGDRISKNLTIDKDQFILFAKDYEGYLFPETYYFLGSEQIEEIVFKMTDEFYERVGDVSKDDVILASLVEGEAKSGEDMKIVAGILKERIKIGMRLQVDVATSTYKTIDLPERPINNPGINAINAVRDPVYTKYLYYITGKDGKMYYAKTFKEHRINIEKYLK